MSALTLSGSQLIFAAADLASLCVQSYHSCVTKPLLLSVFVPVTWQKKYLALAEMWVRWCRTLWVKTNCFIRNGIKRSVFSQVKQTHWRPATGVCRFLRNSDINTPDLTDVCVYTNMGDMKEHRWFLRATACKVVARAMEARKKKRLFSVGRGRRRVRSM